MARKAWEFWIDRGGTFTDIVGLSPLGALQTHKLLSENPERYSDAAVQGMRDLMQLAPDEKFPDGAISAVKMGTTVATNALLERKGERVFFLTTEGLGDLLRIGYQTRPKLFDLDILRPELLFDEVAEVKGRLDSSGQEITPLDVKAVRRLLADAFERGFRSLAVAFMHSYLNPEHERTCVKIAHDIGFEQISSSSNVSRLAKLVPRGDTTVVDAYLSPILRRYVNQVSQALDLGRGCEQLLFMQSNGGLTEATNFMGKDAILSGPAGGIVGMVKTGNASGFSKLIGFDMGGTSTDVSHYNGVYERSFETEVAGVRICAPMMDIHTVAAGGGSICSFRSGRFQVGPESAGANPGPACYRRGGPLTVTDCNVALGKLNAEHFPAVFGPNGDQALDVDAVREKLKTLSLEISGETRQPAKSAEEIAEGFLNIAVENMANAIKKISVERGHDVTTYALQSFGGAGGQHACLVAQALGIKQVMVHPFAGVLSAFGMGLAELAEMVEMQFDAPLSKVAKAEQHANDLATTARAALIAQDVRSDEIRISKRAFLKYDGSQQTLPVKLASAQKMLADFEAAHLARFGFSAPEREVLFDIISVEASSTPRDIPLDLNQAKTGSCVEVPFFRSGEWRSVPLIDRSAIAEGEEIVGPAIITEETGTNIVEPGWVATRDELGTLVLTHEEAQSNQVASTAVDPIRLEVFNNLFMSIADQMGATLANTSRSVNIKERFDFSCAIFDQLGNLVANAPHVPVHLGSMSDAVRAMIAKNGKSAKPGDAYMLNSPFAGGTHLPDVTVITPVFVDDEIAFWLGSRGHHADIGGRTPGSAPPDSQHIDEEGVLFENVHIVKQGQFDEAACRATLLSGRYPCRNPDENVADLKAQVAANETGAAGLLGAVGVHGLEVVSAYMGHVQRNAEDAVRAVIDRLQNGRFELSTDIGAKIAVKVSVDKTQRTARIDFSGTSAQHAGNYNAPFAVCRAVVLYVFRTLVGQNIPLNEGCLIPLEIVAPAGTMLNPHYPAAVIAGNTEVSQLACNALYGALGILACSQGTMNNFVWGTEQFQNYETIAGGTGAGQGFDGCDAVQSHMTNTRMTDPEILEARFPVRLRELRIRKGSGGPGAYCGGEGLIRRLEFLEPVTVTTLCSHRVNAPFGMAGGAPGSVGENWAELADGARQKLAGNGEIELPANAIFEMRTPGGGGFGKP